MSTRRIIADVEKASPRDYSNQLSTFSGGEAEQTSPRRITRQSRKPFGSTEQKLSYPPRNGYHRHWFNDEPGRINLALEAGYTNVKDEDGKPVSRNVGTKTGGGGLIAYLMEIPVEWYQDDMNRAQDAIAEKEKGIKRGYIEKEDQKDTGRYYAGSDKGQIRFEETFSRPR